MATNVKQAYAMINGQKVIATYDEATQLWTVETTAPSASSWSQPDHVYQVTLHAEDEAGNIVSMDSTDNEYGDQLKIRVLEKTKPVATIISPTQNAVLGSNNQDIILEVYDLGGSGLNLSSASFIFNGVDYSSSITTWTDTEDGKKRTTVELYGLADGINTVSLYISDNDGNVSDTATTQFVISTAAPTLSIDTPVNGLITNDEALTVTGTTAPGSDVSEISSVTVNNHAATLTDTDNGKAFSYTVTLSSGENIITIVSTDSVGNSTSISRTVILDKEAPIITDVHAVATTVDANGMIKITFKVTDR